MPKTTRTKKAEPNRVQITFRLPADLVERLRKHADATRRTRTEVIRHSLEIELDGFEPGEAK